MRLLRTVEEPFKDSPLNLFKISGFSKALLAGNPEYTEHPLIKHNEVFEAIKSHTKFKDYPGFFADIRNHVLKLQSVKDLKTYQEQNTPIRIPTQE
jgi:hypothetical protein